MIIPPQERFWKHIKKTKHCWEWEGSTNEDGYGRFKLDTTILVGAHRFMWELSNGDIPEKLCVLHKCDNPRCVKPDHLFLGTHSDNMKDMYIKKRHDNGKSCKCHPDRLYYAKDFCKQCYYQEYYRNS